MKGFSRNQFSSKFSSESINQSLVLTRLLCTHAVSGRLCVRQTVSHAGAVSCRRTVRQHGSSVCRRRNLESGKKPIYSKHTGHGRVTTRWVASLTTADSVDGIDHADCNWSRFTGLNNEMPKDFGKKSHNGR